MVSRAYLSRKQLDEKKKKLVVANHVEGVMRLSLLIRLRSNLGVESSTSTSTETLSSTTPKCGRYLGKPKCK